MKAENILIVADDFTGANDTGVQLRKMGIEAEVTLFPSDEKINKSVVLDTESRTISSDKAYEKVYSMTKRLLVNNDFSLIYNKIDSTIRGNIASSTKALVDLYQPDLVVVAPAFPEIGRTTKNGIHYLNGERIMETELAKDPLNPIKTDVLVEIFETEFNEVVNYSVSELEGGFDWKEAFIHIYDIEESSQLSKLVRICLESEKKILYVGSAGLAEPLFFQAKTKLPSFSVIGSISEVSLSQMKKAEEAGVNVISIELNDLVKDNLQEKYTKVITKSLQEERDTVITVTRKREDYERTLNLFHNLGYQDQKEISIIVREALGSVVVPVLERNDISGLYLTGGDTAIEVIKRIGASGCTIQREITTGVVESSVSGGKFDGLRIITKAGAFGDENTLVESIKYLRG